MGWAHGKKKTTITPADLKDKNVQPLINEISNIFKDTVNSSIGYEIPAIMRQHLIDNVYVFSGCKTYDQLRKISDLLVDGEGNIKSFSRFFKDTRAVYNTYNRQYLESEYIFATQSAQMAGKWADFEAYGDRYNLQYRTAGDDRVRYAHELLNRTTLPLSDPFWSKFLPPNGWRCRCTAVQIRIGQYPVSDSNSAQQWGNEATHTVGKGGVNTSAMFRFNAGKEKIIFPETHPYFDNKEVVQILKEKR
ncbi:phage minor head protein [Dysgonomonas sp. ZJ279]|uniref:phage head morphogenesis protein n=1 Tax=Dysgonomonas sp. ZJ279 TaxID=2709796 RepID=UPI0013EB77EB|nr:phage minor head protein [Dysgonomonas sp. ZJ279]